MEGAVRSRHIGQKSPFLKGGVIALTVIAILPLIFILYYIIKKGITSISWSFLTQLPKPVGETGGGILNAIGGQRHHYFHSIANCHSFQYCHRHLSHANFLKQGWQAGPGFASTYCKVFRPLL